MSVAVCRAMPALDAVHTRMPMPAPARQLDIWNAIQADDAKLAPAKAKTYVLPMVHRSMSHESLDLCTESLGCETGSCDFLDQSMDWLYAPPPTQPDEVGSLPPALEPRDDDMERAGELTAVRYHRSRRQRAFPPPLPSMSRRDGPCLQMRPHRRDGRLVVEAVPVRPHGFLHAQRQGGRLRLCFVDCSARDQRQSSMSMSVVAQEEQHARQLAAVETEQHEDEEEEDDEEDEVEVVDWGAVVEVVAASGKAQRSSRIVINKFVGGTPVSRCVSDEDEMVVPAAPAPGLRRVPSSTTTLAAAVAAASTGMDKDEEVEEEQSEVETKKMLFTSRVGDREELVQSVRRCRQLRHKPLFIVEPYFIATS